MTTINSGFPWFRKIWHLGSSLAICALFFHFDRSQLFPIIFVIFWLFVLLEGCRLLSSEINAAFVKRFRFMMKKEEFEGITTSTYFVLGCLVSLFLFPKAPTLLSILYLGVGDVAASVIGFYWGDSTRRRDGRSWVGTVAGMAVCAWISLFFWGVCVPEIELWEGYLLSIVGAVSFGLSEFVPKWDDNFVIPVLSGLLLTFFGYLLIGDQIFLALTH